MEIVRNDKLTNLASPPINMDLDLSLSWHWEIFLHQICIQETDITEHIKIGAEDLCPLGCREKNPIRLEDPIEEGEERQSR